MTAAELGLSELKVVGYFPCVATKQAHKLVTGPTLNEECKERCSLHSEADKLA